MTFILFFAIVLSGQELMNIIRENQRISSSKFKIHLEIRKDIRKIVKEFKGVSKDNKFFIEFTNPEDKGVRYLRTKDLLYVYLPQIDDVIRLSGKMLQQPFMGSDFSYEDLTQSDPFQFYAPVSLTDTSIVTENFYLLELADTTARAPYPFILMFVDKKDLKWKKQILFSKQKRPIKEMEALEYTLIDNKTLPIKLIVRDLRLKNSSTTLTIEELEINQPIPDAFFQLHTLRK